MNSNDWRSADSLLQWCRGMLLATAPVALGCSWSPAHHKTSIEMLDQVPVTLEGADLDLDECRRYCHAYDRGIAGVEPQPNPVSGCYLATFAVPREAPGPNAVTPALNARAPAVGSTVLVCDYRFPGRFKTPLPGAPFGRPMARAAPFGDTPRTAFEHFQRAAYYEAASVVAFEQLSFDLQALGAPSGLVRAAERARVDEAVHTRLSLAVSRWFDGPRPPPWPRLPRARRRTLSPLDLALENASGGCVNETFGTWLQLYQASAAPDLRLRSVARRIALDEARHAALSFRIFDWLDQKLDRAGRLLVSARLLEATRGLLQDPELPPDVATRIGMPTRPAMARVARELQTALPLATARLAGCRGDPG